MTPELVSYARALGAEAGRMRVLPVFAFAKVVWRAVRERHVVGTYRAARLVAGGRDINRAAGAGILGSVLLDVALARWMGSRTRDMRADPLLHGPGVRLSANMRLGGKRAKVFDVCDIEIARRRRYTETSRKGGVTSAPEALLPSINQHMFGGNGRGRFGRLFRAGESHSPAKRLMHVGVQRDTLDAQRRGTGKGLALRRDQTARGLGVLPLARQGNMARV